MTPLLEQWILASLNEHFNGVKGSYLFLGHGEDIQKIPKETEAWGNLTNTYVSINPQNKTNSEIYVEILLVCTTRKSSEDAYLMEKVVGQFRQGFLINIPIKQRPAEAQFGCLILDNDRPRPIDIVDYTVNDPSVEIRIKSIEALYRMNLP
jgi:hypothetical protein